MELLRIRGTKSDLPRKNLRGLSENMTWETWESQGISCYLSPKNPATNFRAFIKNVPKINFRVSPLCAQFFVLIFAHFYSLVNYEEGDGLFYTGELGGKAKAKENFPKMREETFMKRWESLISFLAGK